MAVRRMSVTEAKAKLDKLLGKARAHSYKPIAIAELLFRHRMEPGTIDLTAIDTYRRRTYDWCKDACYELYGRRPVLNSKYWDDLFSATVISPDTVAALAAENVSTSGQVEAYIYGRIRERVDTIGEMADQVSRADPRNFSLEAFLADFEANSKLRKSIDKCYEIVVYALFDAITQSLNATVTLSVTPTGTILSDFEEFAQLVLGVNERQTSITQPAKLYRVGTANAADAGLDMWANFGPAVQVKHLTLKPSECDEICEVLQADQIVVVCRSIEAAGIEAFLMQLGYREKLRGLITEIQLCQWYDLACGSNYSDTLGKAVLNSIRREMELEFPLTRRALIDNFIASRGYDLQSLLPPWSLGPPAIP